MTGFSRILGDFGFRLLERTHLGHVSFHGVQLQTLHRAVGAPGRSDGPRRI